MIWLKKAGKTNKDAWSIWSSLTVEQDIVSMDQRERERIFLRMKYLGALTKLYLADSLVISSDHDVRLLKSASDLEVPVWESLVVL